MDGNQFDALTRSLASGRSRRSVLKGLSAAVLGVAGLSRLAESADARTTCVAVNHPCEGNQTCCSGLFCAAPVGGRGARRCSCPDGKILCGGNCIDPCPDAPDQCHEASVCDPKAGACAVPKAKKDGTTCEDGNLCTTGDTCQGGVCTAGTAVTCTADHGTAACDQSTGQCEVVSCNSGYQDCNGDPSDGCEVHTKVALNNCGKCGHICPSANGTPSCSNGTCSITCNPGFANCDNSSTLGCHTEFATSHDNCGACGNHCKDTIEVCIGGQCVPKSA